ncbi:aggregation-promoting factor C-terminal-like domain-containing protein [Gordonia metallireducens]|uniref:aggregation-promoting factor C-terminal-like domain-containing protein n=1 Tax=Gordonia metallireducens TaxID=2897779 RepID=UPI001E4E9EFB|nr:tape measure protein [Gordonia metallireducens]
MGHTMSTALGTALGIGVSKAAGAASRVMQDAFKAGYDRITTLEKADIQFRNMGLSAGQTKKQLGDLNNIVTGTSTSLSDAAAAAAMLGGAGVQAGDDMNNAVKALVNISSASGASAKDIGLVMMQIKASGKLMGSEALQLAQRGVPIYDLIAKSIGKTTAEVRTLGEEGKISFDQVVKAINDGTGNLAKEMGETLPAKLANFRTAMGRLSAAGMEPFLLRAKGGVVGLTDAVNTLTPKMKDFALAADAKIFEDWVPQLKNLYATLEGSGALDQAAETFGALWDSLMGLGPAARTIGAALAEASAALGVGGWQLFLATVQTASGVLQGLAPVLETVGNLMEAHPGYVTAALAAWMAFRTVPAILGRVTSALGPMHTGITRVGTAFGGVRPAISGFTDAYRTSLAYVRQANPQISTAGAHIRVLGANAGMAASGGLSALRGAAGGLSAALGGPLNIALMAAGAYLLMGAQAHADATQKAKAQEQAVKDLATAQRDMGGAFRETRGQINDDTWSRAAEQVEAYQKTLATTADRHKSTWDQLKEVGGIYKWATGASRSLNENAERAMAAEKAIKDLGLTNEEVARQLYGTDGQWKLLADRLVATGEGGTMAAGQMQKMRDEFMRQRESAARVAPGVSELGDAMRILGDKTSSAAEKTRALKSALDALNPARTEGEAIAKHNEVMRQVAESTREAINQSEGFGSALISQKLGIDTATKNGAALRQSLVDIVDATTDAAASGADMTERNRENQAALQQLAKQYGLSAEEIRLAADRLGLDDVEVTMALKGAPEAIQQLAAISAKWNDVPGQKTMTIDSSAVTQETQGILERLGATVERIPNTNQVKITADDADARAKILLVTQNVAVLNALTANPKIDLDKYSFDLRNAEARAALEGLDRTSVSPAAGLVIDQLLQGKAVSMDQLNILSQTTANPKVDMEIAAIMKKLGLINTELDRTARERQAYINVQTRGLNLGDRTPDGHVWRGPGLATNSEGSIRRYANGGFRDLEQYANGKLPNQAVIERARPNSLIQWAEPETGGEAFIPLSEGKRGRSTDILATVAKMFGFDLIPAGKMPNSISGIFGEMAGGAVSRLMAKGGRKFADGGITGDALKRLAEGAGASQPLTGAPYVWGGVNWGDCSGAMSAFARAAAGLDPFGGRFSTATMGAQIQQMGGQLGRGGSGDMRFGWRNGGAGGGHTAGTLPDGTNVEMGGGNGGGMMGGSAAGADDPSFTDHAYFRVGSAWSDPGSDPGGWVQRPDGTWEQVGSGNYGAGSGSTSGGSTERSISGLFGDAVKAGVVGQLQDIFSVFGISDTPGVVGAYSEYMNMRNQSGNSSGPTVPKEERDRAKAELDAAKQSLKEDYESAKLARKQDFEQKKQELENEHTLKKIDRATYERKLNELKHKQEQDDLAKKQEYDSRVAEATSRYNSAIGKTPKPGEPGSDPSATLGLKQKYEDEKLARKQKYDAEREARRARYEADKKALDAEKKNGLDKAIHKRRSEELKAQLDSDLRGMQTRYESNELAKKQEYERAAKSVPSAPQQRPGVTDPGTTKPRPGEDMGGVGGPGVAPTGNAIKDAFRSGLREAWRQGPPWDATNWIVNKESTWNPEARNGKYYGAGQYSPEAWAAAGKTPGPDPRTQGEVFDHYVGERYGDPLKAKAHHEANNWYDQGGIGNGIGDMQKRILEPERVLSPRQTQAFEEMVRRDFQGGAGNVGEVVAELRQVVTMLAKMGPGVQINNPTFASESRMVKEQRDFVSRQLMRTGG